MAIILWVLAGVCIILAGGLATELIKPKTLPSGRRRAVQIGGLLALAVAAIAGQRVLDRPAPVAIPAISGDVVTLMNEQDEALFSFLGEVGALAELDLLADDREVVAGQPDPNRSVADELTGGCDPTDVRQIHRCTRIRAADHDGEPAWVYSRGAWYLRGTFEVTGQSMANGGMMIYSLHQVSAPPRPA